MTASGATPSASVPDVASELLVGRGAELSRLEELLGKAMEGSGSVVFITGESGIGKTALVRQFLRRASQRDPTLTLCRGRCVQQYGTGEAYLPFLDALGTLLVGPARERTTALLRTYAPTWCLQLPAVVSDSRENLQQQTIGATKERMLREMGDVWEAAAAAGPIVGLLEDLQWADPSTADLLRHIGNRIDRQRMLVIGTFRPGDLETGNHPLKKWLHEHCQEIALGPLAEDQVAAYLDARFTPHRFPSALAALLHRKTEGHPLFVTSLAQFLVERRDIARIGDQWTLTRAISEMGFEAPESLREVVRRKVEALGPDERVALQYASVMGREFVSTILAALVEVDELALEERLGRLARARVIDSLGEEELPDGSLAIRYRFAHALYQEVLYDDLVSKRRTGLHRQVGEQTMRRYGDQAPRIAAQLASHFERGRDFSSALTFLVHAGDNVARLYAYNEAQEHYAHALLLVEKLSPSERAQPSLVLHEKLGAATLALGRFDLAVESYKRMLEGTRAARDPARECAALIGLCNALFFAHRIEEMAVVAAEALGAAERAGIPERRVEAMVLVALILQDGGNLTECRPLLDEIILTARSLGHGPSLLAGLSSRGCVHYWQSEYEAAEQRLSEALSLASELRDGFRVLLCLTFLGLTRGNRGRMSEALATLEEGITRARRNGDHFWLPRLASFMGWIHREVQDFAQAIERDGEGLRIAREDRAVEAEASALLMLYLDYVQGGRREKAAALHAELEAVSGQRGLLGWFYDIRLQAAHSELCLLQGDLARAEEHARSLLEAAARYGTRTYVVSALRLLAEVAMARAEPDQAATHLAAAVDHLESHPIPLLEWRTYATLARLRSSRGDGRSAQEAYGRAAAVAQRIAAGLDDERLRATFLGSSAIREILEGAQEKPPPLSEA